MYLYFFAVIPQFCFKFTERLCKPLQFTEVSTVSYWIKGKFFSSFFGFCLEGTWTPRHSWPSVYSVVKADDITHEVTTPEEIESYVLRLYSWSKVVLESRDSSLRSLNAALLSEASLSL